MFFKKSAGVAWLVVGLGNPGKKFEGTRHNVGFAALDAAAERWGVEVRRARFDALCGEGRVAGQKALLMKPQTFMNRSGLSIGQAADYYKVPAARVVVLCDDVSLAPGVLRIRLAGSAGGHNGLKSVIAFLGEDFLRVKIGVGEKPHPDYELADWVLARFAPDEQKAVAARYEDVAAACEYLMEGRTAEAMSRFNGHGQPGGQ